MTKVRQASAQIFFAGIKADWSGVYITSPLSVRVRRVAEIIPWLISPSCLKLATTLYRGKCIQFCLQNKKLLECSKRVEGKFTSHPHDVA